MPKLSIRTAASIHEIDAVAWDRLSAGRPFQSYGWYAYGERAMSDSQPLYLLAYEGEELRGRAAFWLVRNEPLPKMLGLFRAVSMTMIRRWPLLICRSPLAQTSGMILPHGDRRAEVLQAFAQEALFAAGDQGASFVVFDYLSQAEADAKTWPGSFSSLSASDPGMSMERKWTTMEEYLATRGRKQRQDYNRVQREVEKLRIRLERHRRPEKIEEALELIHTVESSHGALPNPWARPMLEHMEMAKGTFLTARRGNRLVGCGLLLEDNEAQMTSLLGLAEDVQYVYFALLYGSLRVALEHRVRLLRWGSGATEVKERLGFTPEDNGALVFTAVSPVVRRVIG